MVIFKHWERVSMFPFSFCYQNKPITSFDKEKIEEIQFGQICESITANQIFYFLIEITGRIYVCL
jgi:hypothetical protein